MQKNFNEEVISKNTFTLVNVLENCIKIEKYTQQTYMKLADQTDNLAAKKLLKDLSVGSEGHAEMLTQIEYDLEQKNELKKTINLTEKFSIPKSNVIPDEPSAKQTYQSMITHLDVEHVFRETYTKLSKQIESKWAQKVLELIIADEIRHHKHLQALIKSFEELYPMVTGQELK
jgi:rubrerythrin